MSTKTSIKFFLFLITIFSLLFFFSNTVGWYGYEKWKDRRSTFGNKNEAIERGVFVKDLNYFSSIKLKEFNVYIERGYRYGYFNEKDTRIIKKDKYPYQLCFNLIDTINNYNYDYVNYIDFDTIDLNLYLKKAILEKTLYLKIQEFKNNKWDSIGYIKVWDKQ
ncbi:hypothetical protein [Flavobacterium sp. GSA192]|uniref:hypothetical protein n=1 Tax=Flavobacterium sp. GSA192 TaxID=2576304 RepID=UPI001125C482|nr:hypothetical protein [Flavobacterium sp. GSA192]